MMIGMPEKRVVVLQLCAEVDDGGAMQLRLLLSTLAVAFIVMPLTAAAAASLPDLRGIAPKDVKYYESSTIWCRDNSKTFVKERLNDNFCDCADGTDEPGTPACPDSRFYCMNTGSKTEIVFSSRVNDGICDCCDGSDEYDGSVICLNTCEDGISMEQERKLEVSVEERLLKHFELVRGKHNEDDLLKQDKRSTDVFYSIEVRDVKLVLFLEVAVLAAFLCCHGCKWQRAKHSLKKGLLKPSFSY